MTTIVKEVDALATVADLVAGRIPAELERDTRQLLAHASRRLAAGPQTTVALAGATGSGKSSLFNAISGTRLAEQGARRPTTSKTLGVSFSATNPELLDLLGIERRFEAEPPNEDMRDLVLLDLPDHDSTARAHRDEVDRMVGLVDQFIWVLDPQKYADAAIHHRYLRPLSKHRDVITVVLNQADLLSEKHLRTCMAHIRRLLDADGLGGVPLLATSAVTGLGVDELRSRLGALSLGKRAASERLAADVAVVAARLDEAVGHGKTTQPSKQTLQQLDDQLAAAAGVPIVVDAVEESVQHRGRRATGWPLLSWIGRFRADPLARLRLGPSKEADSQGLEVTRSSLPARSAPAAAHLSSGLRSFAFEVSEAMPSAWQESIAAAVHASERTLPDELDRAVVGTDLKLGAPPLWWSVIKFLQWLLIVAIVVGLGWLTANMVIGYFGLPSLPLLPLGPEGGFQVPLPAVLTLGGLLAGVALSAISRVIIKSTAKAAAKKARRQLAASIDDVAQRRVIQPAMTEIEHYAKARQALDAIVRLG